MMAGWPRPFATKSALWLFAACGWLWLSASAAADDTVEHLPPIEPSPPLSDYEPSVYSTALIPPSADNPAYLPDREEIGGGIFGPPPTGQDDKPPRISRSGRPLPPGARDGMLQRTLVRWTWLAGDGADAMAMHDATLQATLAVPLYIRDTPILLTPHFTFHALAGPEVIDVPPRLYDTNLEIRWMNQVTPRLGVDLAVAPGMYTDFDNSRSDAFRVTGRGIGLWNWNERTQIALGVVYLGRADVMILPAVGLIVGADPESDTRWELIFPRPRIARRVARGLGEHWAYVGGEFGGNSWAVERAAGFDDLLTYSDLRLVLGYELKDIERVSARFEAGYVFARELEYESSPTVYDLDDTFMLRAEASF